MPDDSLKIRVDVETATIKQLNDEVARLKATLQNLDPKSAEFQQASESYRLVKDRQEELNDAIIKGNGHLRALVEGIQGVQTQEQARAEQIQQLVATINSENSTIDQLGQAWRQLVAIREQGFSVAEIATGKEKEIADAVVVAKDKIENARKTTMSSGARLKESYFVIGEQLRRASAENGGYVTGLQLQQAAEALAAQQGISLAQAQTQVAEAARRAGLEQQTLTGFLRDQKMENRLQTLLLRESSQSVIALTGSVGALTGGIGEQTATMKALNASMGQAANAFMGLDFAIKGLGASLGKTGEDWAAMGVTVAGGVALFIGITEAIKATNAEIEKLATEKAKKLEGAVPKMGLGDLSEEATVAAGRVAVITARLNALMAAYSAANNSLPAGLLMRIRPPEDVKNIRAELEAQQKYIKSLEDQAEKLKTDAQAVAQFAEERFRSGMITEDAYIKELKYAEALAGTDKNLKGVQLQSVLVAEIEKKITDLKVDNSKKRIAEVEKEADALLQLSRMTLPDPVSKIIFSATEGERHYLETLKKLAADAQESGIEDKYKELQQKITHFEAEQSKRRVEIEQNDLLTIERAVAGLEERLDKKRFVIQARGVPEKEAKIPFTDMDKEAEATMRKWEMLLSPIADGFYAVGQTIQTEFIDKIVGANSLFQQFVGAVIAGLIRIAEEMAAMSLPKGILTALGVLGTAALIGATGGAGVGFEGGWGALGIPPVPLVPTAGRRPVAGETMLGLAGASRDYSSLMESQAGMGRVHITGSVEVRQRGRDLYGAVKLNRIADIKRGGHS